MKPQQTQDATTYNWSPISLFYSPEPLLYDDPVSTIGDPGLLPAYTYAESNGLRLYDDNGRSAQDVDARLSSRFSSGQVIDAWTQARRHSRLWQSLALVRNHDDAEALVLGPVLLVVAAVNRRLTVLRPSSQSD